MADNRSISSNDSTTASIELGRMWKRSWSSTILSRNVPRENEEIHQGAKQFTYKSDSLRAARSGDRSSVVARFSAPVQNGPGAHQASYTVGTGSFPGVKRPGRGFDHPLPSNVDIKGRERVELHIFSPSGPSWPVLG